MRSQAQLLIPAAVVGLLLTGCDPELPKTYPVSGKLIIPGGDASHLAGHFVEAALEGNPSVRASGVIAADGSFTLETIHGAAILKGAQEGKYKVRILRSEEDDDGKKLRKPPIAARYLKFETAGLTLAVPAIGEVAFTLKPR